MSPEQKSALRSELLNAITALRLPIRCRGLDEYEAYDDSLLFAWSDRKQAIVSVSEDVSWGPDFDSYIEPIDEHREHPVLVVDVPNAIEGRVGEVIDALGDWFAD